MTPRLGRPTKDKKLYKKQKLQERQEAGERNAMEEVYGTGNKHYGLDWVIETYNNRDCTIFLVEQHPLYKEIGFKKKDRVTTRKEKRFYTKMFI